MTDTGCVVDGCTSAQPLPDGYAHRSHTDRAARQLAEIADLTAAARAVATGQTRRGPSVAGGSEPRLQLNLPAQHRLDRAQADLVGIASDISETRGIPILPPPQAPIVGAPCGTDRPRPKLARGTYGRGPLGGCGHGSCSAIRAQQHPGAPDSLVLAARFVERHVEWLRHRPYVDEALDQIAGAHRLIVGLLNAGGGRRYLGPCGALVDADTRAECDGDVYAREGASTGACRACGGEVDVHARRAWLDETVRARSFRASQIEAAFGIRANTIVKWAARGRLVPDLVPLPDGVHGPWAIWEDEQGRRRYHLGAVLELAEQDAARRRLAEAKRAEREAEAA